MSIDTPNITAGSPHITAHARERWLKRARTDRFDADLRTIFDEAVPVGLPPSYDGNGVLHPPSGTLLIYKGAYTADPAVVTVLVADWVGDELNDDHLKRCGDCGLRYRDRGDDECDWCAGDTIGGRP